MKFVHVVAGFSGPLLALSGQAAARNPANLEITEVQKVTDEKEGTFRPFVEFALAGQSMRGLLDTGSSNWNVPRTGSKFCKDAGAQCDPTTTGFKAGSLDLAKAGKQVRDLKMTFNDSYTGGASFIGRFMEAPLQVSKGGKAVPVQIGLVEDGAVPEGGVSFPVLGVGPVDGEFVEKPYDNVPARFKQAGKTKVNAFGLHIGDFRSPHSGSLVWGGYDAAKIEGQLKAAPMMQTDDGAFPFYTVELSSIRLSPVPGSHTKAAPPAQGHHAQQKNEKRSNKGKQAPSKQIKVASKTFKAKPGNAAAYSHTHNKLSAKAIFRREQAGNLLSNDVPPVVWLDTGVPAIMVPTGTYNKLRELLGAKSSKDADFLVDCKRIHGVNLLVGMNKEAIQIRIPLDSMLSPRKANEPCNLQFGEVTAQSGGTAVLGAPALQHMYVVFDNDSKFLSIAQAKTNPTGQDIRAYVPVKHA
ncbi:hypothetical protein E4U43_008213 [Claviceps pusilla]|uniref:Peptidase A1 domain-containing protein n=1 Tax=Claviceps pusilla TaxID=123648 RepID=A0A9P7SYF7_9HYPO|nr:hypothetical protein E4U43_008213 [Claviceps pusilla]